MEKYKYHLEKYHPGSKKLCPQCGRKFCFTRYVDACGNYVFPEHVGRCDHEHSCGYHFTPSDYFRENPEESISLSRKHVITPKNSFVPIQEQPPSLIDGSIMEQTLSHYAINPLYTFLARCMDVSILTGYVSLGIPMEYLLMASMLVPVGSILISKIILPEVETAESLDELAIDGKGSNRSPIEAVINGASVGVTIVIGISASLIAIIGMVALLNMILGFAGLSLEIIFGYIFAPFGYLMGFDGAAALQEGTLLGQKIALNEFVAFSNLGSFIGTLDARTAMMASISLAGFANVGSMAICVGGVGALCPGKKGVLSQLVLRGMIGGALLSILSAMLCGLVALF